MSEPRERVGWVLSAAARLSDDTDPIGAEARRVLPGVVGLSREGVELALRTHLETRASEAQVEALVAASVAARRAHVVLASNVFVAASRALALAFGGAASVVLRPSRREPAFVELLTRALPNVARDRVEIAASIDPGPGDAVYAYGRDESLRAIESTLPTGVVFWGHGSGLGVAVVESRSQGDDAAAAEALAGDVVAFDQRGCLSPRVVVFVGGEGACVRFASEVSRALVAWAQRVPLGGDAGVSRAYLDVMRAVGEVAAGPWGAVAVDLEPRALVLPEGDRALHVARVDAGDVARAGALFGRLSGSCACLGGEGAIAEHLASISPQARRARLGSMQRPPLDGPVDRRTRPRVVSGR